MQENKTNEEEVSKKVSPKYVLALILFFAVGLGMGLFARWHKQIALTEEHSTTDLSRFEEVYQMISDDWVDANENSELNLESAAIKGFLENIGDPHTTYFTAEQLAEFTSMVDGSFAGIGVTYSLREDGGLISSVMEETPASKAGILPGDKLVAVDGKSILGLSNADVKAMVTGDAGTKVVLTILRDGQSFDVEVIRQKIDSSVTYEKRDGNIGYLDINTFGDLTDQSVKKALEFFKAEGVETIVIDLRDNTGGYLSAVQNVLSLFIPKDVVVFSMQEKSGPQTDFRSLSDENFTFNHGYVLTNKETASASEVMAGALNELLEYQLVGTTTYGKGTAQTQIMLSDMSSVKYTYAKWFLPSGKCINGIGLIPDLEVDAPSLADFYNIILKDDETLSYDLVSQKVADMQHMLVTLGYETGRVDGYFDEQSVEALKAFEKDHGLVVDGIYAAQDNNELVSALIAYFADPSHDACYQRVLKEIGA